MRIVFFGTPEFAVPSLRALLGEGFDVVAVVTQPDRPQGRSRSEALPPPVKTVALDHHLTVFQPERPDLGGFVEELRQVMPTLGVVVAYGHILKPELLALPTLGMVNVHASLLPKLRGAAPIVHAILEGSDQTGISVMQMDRGLDTGPVLLRAATPIAPDETGGELTARLAELGALALVEALTLLASGTAKPEPQDHAAATYAAKLTREHARIKWTESVTAISRQVRALDPKPGTWTTHGHAELKLFGPQRADDPPSDAPPGTIVATDPALVVAAGDGALQFLDVQPAGRTRMAAGEWVRGRAVQVGDRFT
ncbi:MAG TPA: methionyl-tRNA formyltransferase [Gemmatimonadales bacterium]